MPILPLSTLIVLGLVIAAFVAFGVTLFAASLYVAFGKPAREKPVAREVTPARRIGALQRQ
jgi:hypothetical protein